MVMAFGFKSCWRKSPSLSVHSCHLITMETRSDNNDSCLTKTFVNEKDGRLCSFHQLFKSGMIRVITYDELGCIKDVVVYTNRHQANDENRETPTIIPTTTV